jgi:hypothetical protein
MFEALEQARQPVPPASKFALAKENKLPYTTFRTYFNAKRTVPRMGVAPVLSDTAMAGVIKWVGDRNFAAAPVPKELVAEKMKTIVEDLREKVGPSQRKYNTLTGEPGKNVWARIRKLYPELSRRVASRHSAATLRAILNPATYTNFFDIVRDPLRQIPMARRYTADEFALSANKNNSKVLYIKGTGHCQALEADGYTAHVSLINNVCGDGSSLETVLIFGKRKEDIQMKRLNQHVMTLGYTRAYPLHAGFPDLSYLCCSRT